MNSTSPPPSASIKSRRPLKDAAVVLREDFKPNEQAARLMVDKTRTLLANLKADPKRPR